MLHKEVKQKSDRKKIKEKKLMKDANQSLFLDHKIDVSSLEEMLKR